MNILDKLERKFGKFAIHHLILYIVFANAAVYILSFTYPEIISLLIMNPNKLLQGEIWRLFTFVFIPPSASPIFIFFALYFYYLIGMSLEREWGAFKFNIYYFTGAMAIIIVSLMTGMPMVNTYLNLSLFFAFARLFPDFTVRVMLVLPVKIKYLAWINWGFFGFTIIFGGMAQRIAAIIGIANFLLFFGKEIITNRKSATRSYIRKREYMNKNKVNRAHFHQCEVCGRTELDNKDLEFRYCSKCDGHHEYCMEHLFTHEHIKH